MKDQVGCWLWKLVLPSLLERACPARFPRSGREGEAVDCFVVSVDRGGEPYLVVLGIEGDELRCLEWTEHKFSTDRAVSLSEVQSLGISVTHFWGLDEIEYSRGPLCLLISRAVYWPYFRIRMRRIAHRVSQGAFNRRNLVKTKRMDLLRHLVEEHPFPARAASPIDLMSELYSLRWVLHPRGDEQLEKLELFLDSLVERGLVVRNGGRFNATSRALEEIERYEEEERRHRENVVLQRIMMWLTVAIAALTVIQTGLVKLPTMLDLSTGRHSESEEVLSSEDSPLR